MTVIPAADEATAIETARPITAGHTETLSTPRAQIATDAKRRSFAEKRAGLASAILGPRVARPLVAAHAIGIVAGGWVTVALADSLFFRLTVDASRPQVLRYLAITIVPAAGLTRLIGPAVDRSRGGPGRTARHSNVARCLCAVGLAVSLGTSAFFAWALLLLVANRLFTTSRYAMLPMLIQDRERLVAANVRLSKWGGVAGGFGVATGLVLSHTLGTRALLVAAAAVFYVAARCRPIDVERHQPVDGEGSARPAASRRLRTASISLVAVRGAVGLLTFTCAFAVRGGGAPAVVFAAIGVSYAVGSFLGNAAAPAARQRTSEDRMIVGSLLAAFVACSIAAVVPGYGPFVAASFFVGAASSHVRQAFDSILQSESTDASRGRLYAAFEIRTHLGWVAGSAAATLLRLEMWQSCGAIAGASLASLAVWRLADVTPTPPLVRLRRLFDTLRVNRRTFGQTVRSITSWLACRTLWRRA